MSVNMLTVVKMLPYKLRFVFDDTQDTPKTVQSKDGSKENYQH